MRTPPAPAPEAEEVSYYGRPVLKAPVWKWPIPVYFFLTLGRRRRPAAVAGAALVLAGSLFERLCVSEAGVESARDPQSTIGPQRRRLTEVAGGTT